MIGSAQDVTMTAVQAGGTAATIVGTAMHAAWVPVVGPIIAGVTIALGLLFNRKGPRQKAAATQIVDQVEIELRKNLEGYRAMRTKSAQEAALRNFDAAWAWLESQEGCGNRELGEPGRRCLSERAPGGKWDWFAMYRTPIEQDNPPADVLGLPLSFEGDSPARLLLPAGLILAGVLL